MQEIRQTFDELRPLLKRNGKDKFEVLTGAGEHDTKDTNMLSLISRLYQLSGEAKVRKGFMTCVRDPDKLRNCIITQLLIIEKAIKIIYMLTETHTKNSLRN